ncbi:MAG TPA: hypothetical protein DCM26_03395 [Desulfotomaculum sp.]|nr:hypothetical protein [Desulfotomaculum sp.]
MLSCRPLVMETFVEQERFQGTCYCAANWIHVRQTQGRSKLDTYKLKDKPIKDVFLFPPWTRISAKPSPRLRSLPNTYKISAAS